MAGSSCCTAVREKSGFSAARRTRWWSWATVEKTDVLLPNILAAQAHLCRFLVGPLYSDG